MSKLVIETQTGDKWELEKEVEVTSRQEALGYLVEDLVNTASTELGVSVVRQWVVGGANEVSGDIGHGRQARARFVA